MYISAEMTLTEAVLAQIEAGRGGSAAILSDRGSLTYTELMERATRLASFLKDRGIRKGDCVGVLLYKSPVVAETFLACSLTGAIYTPINFKLPIDRIRFQIDHVPVRFLFLEHDFRELFHGLAPLFPEREKVIFVKKGLEGYSYYEDIERYPARFDPYPAGMDDILYLNYTSGTTGTPKGAVTTHRNLFHNTLACNDFLGMREDDVFLCLFSVFAHPHELFYRSIFSGGKAVLYESLSPRTIAEVIEEFRVTWVMAVPSFYQMMSDRVERGDFDLSSLRVLESGGAVISNSTLEILEDRFQVEMIPVWGSTETTGVALAMTTRMKRKTRSMGIPLPTYDFQVLREDGTDSEPGEIGEMIVRGPGVVDGYWKMPEETSSLFKGGVYWTADHVRRDEEGYFFFVNRKTDMMKIGGIRVYPSEIENVLMEHPLVRDVVVVGDEERLRGEIARAVVLLQNTGSSITGDELKSFCRRHLALYQVPRIVEFWKEIPRTPVGKIDRKRIREIIRSRDRHD